MNRDFVFVTDADCEIPIEWESQFELAVLPMPFSLEGKEYLYDLGKTVDMKSFYEKMRKGAAPTTAQANPEDFKQLFIPYLDDEKDILYLGVSSALSGTVNNAALAASELLESYPKRKIIVVDSLSISMPMGVLVRHAAQMRMDGESIESVRDWLMENRQRAFAFFTVNDLTYLKRGGRVSGAAAFFGTLLEIKPMLYINGEGKLVPCTKVKGRKNAIKQMAKMCAEYADNIEQQIVYLLEADCPEEAQTLVDALRDIAAPIDVQVVSIGPVIGSHAGPGTLGIVFMAKNRDIAL